MKPQLRLNSNVPNGVGSGPEAIAIDVIYAYLLMEAKQNSYAYISINQIGNDLNEFVMKAPGRHIHCNIRYAACKDFDLKTIDEQNRIRLDIIHKGLVRIAEYDRKLDVKKLEDIKEKILEANFSFEFICKIFINKKNRNISAQIVVSPKMAIFDYYIIIYNNGKQECKELIYSGKPVSIYSYSDFFGIGKWKGLNEFILTGKINEVETRLLIEKCNITIINLTPYEQPPYYTLMKAHLSDVEREKAKKDWEHSLPPAAVAVIRQSRN